MYEARQHKDKVSRRIDIKNGIIPHVSTIQLVKTVAIETEFFKRHIYNDAVAVNDRKSTTHGVVAVPIGSVDRFSFFRRNHLSSNMQGIEMGQIRPDELLILVSHGIRYLRLFANKTPKGLAKEVFNSNILPIGYYGQIYLDGCHTGEPKPFGHLGDGSSFAEKFKHELQKLSDMGVPRYGNFTVKGNLGAALTQHGGNLHGTEWIEGDKRTLRLIDENIENMTNIANSIPLWTSDAHQHSEPTTISEYFGLINRPGFNFRGRFTKVVY